MSEYKPRKGFFDLSERPKKLGKRLHKNMQEIQLWLMYVEENKEYCLKHDLNSWATAQECSARLQQLIFKYYPNALVKELEQ